MSAPNALLVSELSKAVLSIRTSDQQRKSAPTVLIFCFAFPGPWGHELARHAETLARDIAVEPGLKWKIWLEDRNTGHAGGIYLFENGVAAEHYRRKHAHRLSAAGFAEVTIAAFQVNVELSVLTSAAAALGRSDVLPAAAFAGAAG